MQARLILSLIAALSSACATVDHTDHYCDAPRAPSVDYSRAHKPRATDFVIAEGETHIAALFSRTCDTASPILNCTVTPGGEQ